MKNIINVLSGQVLACLMFFVVADAQKLPGTQQAALRAPVKVKVDGKATEWDNKYQAYNRATQVFYTVANDDNKLYFTLHADKREIINKIINGGISFTIAKGPKKTTYDGMTVTFPVFSREDRPYINVNAAALIEQGTKDTQRQTDSLMQADNSSLTDKAKYIRITGIKDMDTLISVYNVDGIKAAARFDNKIAFTYELSIDLKLLDLSAKDLTKFNYNIRLNEMQVDYVPGVQITRNDAGEITMMNVVNAKLANSYISALNTTDCWGEYTLIK